MKKPRPRPGFFLGARSRSRSTQRVAEQICANVRALAIAHSAPNGVCVTFSVGGATAVPCRGESYAPLLEAADAALYEAKRTGKNRAVNHEFR